MKTKKMLIVLLALVMSLVGFSSASAIGDAAIVVEKIQTVEIQAAEVPTTIIQPDAEVLTVTPRSSNNIFVWASYPNYGNALYTKSENVSHVTVTITGIADSAVDYVWVKILDSYTGTATEAQLWRNQAATFPVSNNKTYSLFMKANIKGSNVNAKLYSY